MRRTCVWLALAAVTGACGSDEHLAEDGPTGSIDAAHDDGAYDAAALVDAAHVDATHYLDATTDAVPPDAAPVLPLLWTDGGDLGLVEASVAGTGFVRFDNNSGADVVLDNTYVTGTDYTVLGSTCIGTIPDQAWCRVDVQVIPTAIGPRPGQVIVAGPAGAAHADLTATGGGRVNIIFAGPGTGSVPGLHCPGSCTAVLGYGAAQAYPAHASTFVSWDQPGCGSSTTCYFDLTVAPKTVTATFGVDPNARKLTVHLAGTGKGLVGAAIAADQVQPCGNATCEYWFLPGDQLWLEATAASVFGGWSGSCTGSTPSCIFDGTVNTSVTATFSPDPYERVTFLLPPGGGGPYTEVDPDGDTITTGGTLLTATAPGGAELWSMPVAGVSVQEHGSSDTVPDYAGGSWVMQMAPGGDNVEVRHFDVAGNLLAFFPDVGGYDAMMIGDPSTGVPVISSTGHSHWRIERPGMPGFNEDLGDFAGDIEHAVMLDSNNAIVAARHKFDVGVGGVVRNDPGGYVTHAPFGDDGLQLDAINTGPGGLVVYSGQLWVGPNGQPPIRYQWIQVLDFSP